MHICIYHHKLSCLGSRSETEICVQDVYEGVSWYQHLLGSKEAGMWAEVVLRSNEVTTKASADPALATVIIQSNFELGQGDQAFIHLHRSVSEYSCTQEEGVTLGK